MQIVEVMGPEQGPIGARREHIRPSDECSANVGYANRERQWTETEGFRSCDFTDQHFSGQDRDP